MLASAAYGPLRCVRCVRALRKILRKPAGIALRALRIPCVKLYARNARPLRIDGNRTLRYHIVFFQFGDLPRSFRSLGEAGAGRRRERVISFFPCTLCDWNSLRVSVRSRPSLETFRGALFGDGSAVRRC
jgi:hypothetical protein